MTQISCPECGKDIPSDAKDCPKCGYPITSTEAKEEIEDKAAEEAANNQEPDSTEIEESEIDVKADESDTNQSPSAKNAKSDRKKKYITVAVALVSLIILVSLIVSCANKPEATITKIKAEYDSSLAVFSDGTYTMPAGTKIHESSMEAEVTYSNGTGQTFNSVFSKKDDFVIDCIDGPSPLENGTVTVYRLTCASQYKTGLTNKAPTKDVELRFEGAEVESLTFVNYSGNKVDGTKPDPKYFKLDVTFSNGVKGSVTPEKVEGEPLTGGQATTYTLSYGGVSVTAEVVGEPKKEESASSSSSSSSAKDSSSSSEGASYKSSCKTVSYNDLIINESSLRSKDVKFTGKVYKVLGKGAVTNAYIVDMTKTSGGTWEDPVYMDVTTSHLSRPLSVGDVCTFYGEYDGLVSASDIGLSSKRIPSFAIDYVDIG